MNIKLNWFRIENFKGIKNFRFELNGKNTNIYGNNATYKTSTEDAWRWLLFNKDSNDKEDTNFTIKPQDENGKDIMSTESIVEAELSVNGKPLRIKKARVEDWIKKSNTFKGHKRLYWFDEEPVSATVYQSKISELINETTFKMITNPLYFNTQVDWKKRREVLFDIFIKDTDEEIILSNRNISRLTEILDGKTVESYKAIVMDKIKKLKKEKDDLPPRISEVISSLPQNEPDYTVTETTLSEFKEGLAQIDVYMTSAAKKTEEVNKKNQQLNTFKNQLEEVKVKIKAGSGADKQKLINEKSELENGKLLLSSGIKTLNLQIEQANKTLEANAETRKELLDEWRSLNDQVAEMRSSEFELDTDSTESICPTCKQDLPTEDIENQAKELEANFNKAKLANLEKLVKLTESNKTKGLALKEKTEKANLELIELQSEMAEKEEKLEEILTKISSLDIEIAKPSEGPNYETNKEYALIKKAIEKLQAELDKPAEDDTTYMLNKKTEIQNEIDKCNAILNDKEETAKKKERVKFLKTEEKRVANLIAELEGHNFLIEEFYVTKTGMVNSNFKHVRFRFFEDNDTNDNKKEMCVAEVNTNGSYVKFEDANLAGQVNAGLDIINFLSEHYKAVAPIFLDNRESVSEIIKTDAQVINLIKPPTWNELDKEVQEALIDRQAGNLEKAKKAWDDRNNTLRVVVEG